MYAFLTMPFFCNCKYNPCWYILILHIYFVQMCRIKFDYNSKIKSNQRFILQENSQWFNSIYTILNTKTKGSQWYKNITSTKITSKKKFNYSSGFKNIHTIIFVIPSTITKHPWIFTNKRLLLHNYQNMQKWKDQNEWSIETTKNPILLLFLQGQSFVLNGRRKNLRNFRNVFPKIISLTPITTKSGIWKNPSQGPNFSFHPFFRI